jgi:hypothetical protein
MEATQQRKPEMMQKAEFIAKIFSDLPSDQAEQVMELANTYLDGINVGIRLMARQIDNQEEA